MKIVPIKPRGRRSDRCDRLLAPRQGALFGAATGCPMRFQAAAVECSWGSDCEVGLQDGFRLTRDRQAESNTKLVDVVERIDGAVGRPIAPHAELRAPLGSWAARMLTEAGA